MKLHTDAGEGEGAAHLRTHRAQYLLCNAPLRQANIRVLLLLISIFECKMTDAFIRLITF